MKKVIWLSIIIVVIEVIAALILLPLLPEQIPIHWNIHGAVDGYGGKWFIFLSPLMTAAFTGLLAILPRIDPKRRNAERSAAAYSALILMLNLLFVVMFIITALASLDIPVSVNHILLPAIGILFIGLGNYMPKIKQNYFFGIRLPWTLANETVWTKTHRLGGWLFMLDGFLFVIAALVPPPLNFILPMAGVVLILVVTTVYSYIIFRKQPDGD